MLKGEALLFQQHCTTTFDLGVFMTTLLLRHSSIYECGFAQFMAIIYG